MFSFSNVTPTPLSLSLRIIVRPSTVFRANRLASVSLMDLSVEAEAFGATVRYADNEVPAVTGQFIADEDAAESLKIPKVGDARTGVCVEAIRLAKARIKGKPVFAGIIGPYSLAGRLMDVTEIMYACYDEPDMVKRVLDKAAQFLVSYAKAMKDAGADGVVMAEPLAGLLSGEMVSAFSVPYVKRIIDEVQTDDFAVIYHNCGSVMNTLGKIFSQNAAAYHFGNAVKMDEVLKNAPATALCMGNVDPAGQFAQGTPESIRERTLDLMARCAGYENFLPSSGCDIPAHASWKNIDAFFCAIDEFYKN